MYNPKNSCYFAPLLVPSRLINREIHLTRKLSHTKMLPQPSLTVKGRSLFSSLRIVLFFVKLNTVGLFFILFWRTQEDGFGKHSSDNLLSTLQQIKEQLLTDLNSCDSWVGTSLHFFYYLLLVVCKLLTYKNWDFWNHIFLLRFRMFQIFNQFSLKYFFYLSNL